jgi:hypothetical protein
VNRERHPRLRSSAPVLVAIAAVAIIAATTEASTTRAHIAVPNAINVWTPPPERAAGRTAAQPQRASTAPTARSAFRENAATPDPADDPVTVTATAPVIVSAPAVETSAVAAGTVASTTVTAPSSTTVPPPSTSRPVSAQERGTGEDQQPRSSMTVAAVRSDYPVVTDPGPTPFPASTTDS